MVLGYLGWFRVVIGFFWDGKMEGGVMSLGVGVLVGEGRKWVLLIFRIVGGGFS